VYAVESLEEAFKETVIKNIVPEMIDGLADNSSK